MTVEEEWWKEMERNKMSNQKERKNRSSQRLTIIFSPVPGPPGPALGPPGRTLKLKFAFLLLSNRTQMHKCTKSTICQGTHSSNHRCPSVPPLSLRFLGPSSSHMQA